MCRLISCSSTKGKIQIFTTPGGIGMNIRRIHEKMIESSGNNSCHIHTYIHKNMYAIYVNIKYGQDVIFYGKSRVPWLSKRTRLTSQSDAWPRLSRQRCFHYQNVHLKWQTWVRKRGDLWTGPILCLTKSWCSCEQWASSTLLARVSKSSDMTSLPDSNCALAGAEPEMDALSACHTYKVLGGPYGQT